MAIGWRLLVLPGLLAAASGALATSAPIDAGWTELVRAEDGDCRLSVTGDGRFHRIALSGLTPGANARYRLANADMPPIDWRVRADDAGQFARYYLPLLPGHDQGLVTVRFEGPGCSVAASFAWQRRGIVVH